MEVVDSIETVLTTHPVETGDIRVCQVKDGPIADWVGLAVRRARNKHTSRVLANPERPSDVEMIKSRNYLPNHNTEGLEIYLLSPEEAMQFTLERSRDGLDTISATGMFFAIISPTPFHSIGNQCQDAIGRSADEWWVIRNRCRGYSTCVGSTGTQRKSSQLGLVG